MQQAGFDAIEIAKNNGSWNALDLSDNLVYPAELKNMLEKNPDAKTNFKSFPEGSRRNTLQWIYDAKTEQTKMKRIKQVLDAAKENKRLR